jgi:2-keto-3-deoxy-L-rhamnonate aldolase RhmA
VSAIRRNTTKRSLLKGKAVIGPFVFFGDPVAVELAAAAGFDFVVVDMEHTAHGLAEIQHLVRAAETFEIAPIVRVPEVDEKLILRVLETGAQGVMVPMLETAEDAARAVEAVRYPPSGRRGTFSHSRPARYGLAAASLSEFFAESDQEVLLIGLIETPLGVENIDEILNAGVEVVVVGRGDLSSFIGVPGQPSHPAVAAAAKRVFEAVERRGGACWAGIAGAVDARDMEMWGSQGCRFFLWRDDWSVLLDAWRLAVEERRLALDSLGSRLDGSEASDEGVGYPLNRAATAVPSTRPQLNQPNRVT